MNNDTTATAANPDGAEPTHGHSMDLAVLGLMAGAALTFLTTLVIVHVSGRIVSAMERQSTGGTGVDPEMIDFIEACLKLPIMLAAFIMAPVMIIRLLEARKGASREDAHEPAAAGDGGDDHGFPHSRMLSGLPRIGKVVAFFGWMFVLIAVASAIFGAIPSEFYQSFFVLIEVLAGAIDLELLRDPTWDRIVDVGDDISILVYVPAINLYCSAERKRMAKID